MRITAEKAKQKSRAWQWGWGWKERCINYHAQARSDCRGCWRWNWNCIGRNTAELLKVARLARPGWGWLRWRVLTTWAQT